MLSNTSGPVAALAAAVTDVLETDLTRLCDDDIADALRQLEQANRKLDATFSRVVVETEERGMARHAGCTSTAGYLQDVLRLSRRDATARVTAAKKLGTWHDVGGHPIPVDLPATAAAQARGDIGAEHARVVARVMNRVPHTLPDTVRTNAEKILAECAKGGTPDDVEKAGDRLIAYVDPDGKLTDDRDRKRRRGIRIGKQGADLMSTISGEITPTLRALLEPWLAKHARPGMNNPDNPLTENPDPTTIANAATTDTRTAAQRNHDALQKMCETALESPKAGTHRGLPVAAIITMTLDQLEEASGVATTATGGAIPVSDALTLAEKTRPWLAIFDHTGCALHFGRTKRLAQGEQRLILIPFEGGCTKPGCTKPAALCAVHHPDEWADGGKTDIENETFVCDGCHALVTKTDNGWKTIKAGPDDPYPGRTQWIPPKHIDPEQKPRVNHCHHPEELLQNAIDAAAQEPP